MAGTIRVLLGSSRFWITVFAPVFIFTAQTTARRTQTPFANLEPAQTNPIRLSADTTRLFAVNSENASLSVFDVTQPTSPSLLAEIPVGVGPVSVNPRSDDEVWVVNQVSNTVSVVSVSQGIVTDTIVTGRGTEPMDVVFAGSNQAYVSYSRSNQIGNFDKLAGTKMLRRQIMEGVSEEIIRKSWEPALARFKSRRKKYLLYPE